MVAIELVVNSCSSAWYCVGASNGLVRTQRYQEDEGRREVLMMDFINNYYPEIGAFVVVASMFGTTIMNIKMTQKETR
jgi:hypothetical protein